MTLALAGCGGVEFEGKVFDYMGLSGERQEADVRMTERPPLMLPPDARRLPQPGQAGMATARQDWPTNPETVRKQAAAEKKAKVNAEEAKRDPLNAYAGKPTLLDRWLGSSDEQKAAISDTPEPDPTDARPQQDIATSAPRGLKPHQPDAPIDTGADAFRPPTPSTYTDPSAQRSIY